MEKYVVQLLLLVIAGFASAVTTTTPEGLQISAEKTLMDFNSGVLTYEGDVVITKEGLSFTADFMQEYRQERKIAELKARGNPMVYINILATDQGIYRGEAMELYYSKREAKVTLDNFVLIDAEGNTHRGKTGTFWLKNE